MWSFNPKPRPYLPIMMPSPGLGGSDFLNSPASKEAKKKYIDAVNKLADVFGMGSVKSDFIDEILKFYGDDAQSQLGGLFDDALDAGSRIDIFSDVKASGSSNSVPAKLKGKNLKEILAGKDYSKLTTEEGIALLKAIKAVVEQIDSTSSEVLKWVNTNDCTELFNFGAFNSALFGYLMEAVQEMPSQVKGMFATGSDFQNWATKTLSDYEKSFKNQKKDPPFNIEDFKNSWNGLAAKVEGWEKIDVSEVRSFVNRPMMNSSISVKMINQTNSGRSKREKEEYRVKEERRVEEEKNDIRLKKRRVQRKRAEELAAQSKPDNRSRKRKS